MVLRTVVAVAVLVSGGVHLKLWLEGYRDIDVVGPAFLLNVVAAAVIAVAVLAWRHWLPLLAAIGFGAATLVAFVISTTVGLFGVHEQWSGGDVLTAAVSEGIAVVLGATALLRERRPTSSGRQLQDPASGQRPHVH
jgi:hypothetical protein